MEKENRIFCLFWIVSRRIYFTNLPILLYVWIGNWLTF